MDDKPIFGLQYDNNDKRYLLHLEINKIFQNYWSIFKQIDMKNFSDIGEKHALVLEDNGLRESIKLIVQIYEEWQRYLNDHKETGNFYKEFRRFLISENCYLAKLPEIIAYEFDDVFDYELIEDNIAMTFNFENPQVVRSWWKNANKKTPMQRYFFKKYYSSDGYFEYENKEALIIIYEQDFLIQLNEVINHINSRDNEYHSIFHIDVAGIYEIWEKRKSGQLLIDIMTYL